MAKSKWILLLLTGIISGLSVIALSVSFSTDYWVTSEAKYDDESVNVRNLEASYGLFTGKLDRYLLTSLSHHDLTIECNYGINKCFFSCQQTVEKRQDELNRLLNDETLAECPKSTMRSLSEQVNETSSDGNGSEAKAAKYEKEFLSAGLWLTTIVFLGFSIGFALLSVFFSMINIWCHPAQLMLSVFGLYIWNGIAAGCCVLTLIFYGSTYMIFIAKNIGITDTLRSGSHYSSNDLSSLGISYWILFISFVCHLVNIGLIYYRNYLLMKEPKPAAITVQKNDSTILVY